MAPMEATLHTNLGDIRLELYPEQAPETVSNFVGLATGQKAWTDPRTGEESHAPLYDNVIFHRVIPRLHDPGAATRWAPVPAAPATSSTTRSTPP